MSENLIGFSRPSTEELEKIERFRTAFNNIEKLLAHEVRASEHATFTKLLNAFSERNPGWRETDGQKLRAYSGLRNALVHDRLEPQLYLSVPLPFVVEDIEKILQRLRTPERIIHHFETKVATVRTTDSLSNVLELIHTNAFSQFPVYDNQDLFKGLLTENGITRWLALKATSEQKPVRPSLVTVETILRSEEKRQNFRFVPKHLRVDEVMGLFSNEMLLEAVLVTEHGKNNENLLGIATRWDIPDLLNKLYKSSTVEGI